MLIFPLIGESKRPFSLVRPRGKYLSQVFSLVLQLSDAQGKYELLKDCLRVIALRACGCCCLLSWLELECEHLCLHKGACLFLNLFEKLDVGAKEDFLDKDAHSLEP